MSRPRVLIVYGSSYGQTAKIATFVRELLIAQGCDVLLMQGDQPREAFRVSEFDGVLVGASLIGGTYQSYIARFVREHRNALNQVPSGFFAVSGSAGSPHAENRAEAVRHMEVFLAEAGWRPRTVASVAGAMAYSRYNPILRFVMRRLARQNGETDTRRDREYTDWNQVRRFAERFRSEVRRRVDVQEGELLEA